MIELVSIALMIIGLVFFVFALGAQAGWVWATKSLAVRPPLWIPAVLTAAGVAFVGSAVVRADWMSAVSAVLLYGLVVGSQLRRRSPSSHRESP